MPISTSSSAHFLLSGSSRARRRRILWQLNDLTTLPEEEVQPASKIETIMQDQDLISFDYRLTFSGLELEEKKELKPISLPDLDELVKQKKPVEQKEETIPEPVSAISDVLDSDVMEESDADLSTISESGIFSDSKIMSENSESTISQINSTSFQPFRELLESDTPVTWLFAGDSITHGANFTHGYRIYSEHFSERVRTEMKRSNDVIINTAVAGETTKAILKKIEDRIIRFQPDVVSLMIGIDDSESGAAARRRFEKNLRSIIEQVRESGSMIFLHTPPYFDPSEHKAHADIRAFVRTIRETSREYFTPCLDHWNLWKAAHKKEKSIENWYAPNGVHPSAQGHHELAKQIFRRLGIFDTQSPTCSESVHTIQ